MVKPRKHSVNPALLQGLGSLEAAGCRGRSRGGGLCGQYIHFNSWLKDLLAVVCPWAHF